MIPFSFSIKKILTKTSLNIPKIVELQLATYLAQYFILYYILYIYTIHNTPTRCELLTSYWKKYSKFTYPMSEYVSNFDKFRLSRSNM
jgi:hypothetical protein